jgi:hypothetical protein
LTAGLNALALLHAARWDADPVRRRVQPLKCFDEPLIGRGYLVRAGDVREDLDRFAPIGSFDVVTVVVKAWNDQDAVPFFSWGIAYSPTLDSTADRPPAGPTVRRR